jgi:ATP-dependent Clp protease ATP-binding subunit ClpC
MHRFATAPRSTFEELFTEAGYGTVVLEGAEYPPVCDQRSGEVTLSLGPTGAMIVHVRRCPCRSEDFRLRLLFDTGVCVFSDARDLHSFWSGPLAAAFGITSPHPVEETVEEAPQDGHSVPSVTVADPAGILDDLAPATGRVAASGPRRLTAARLTDELARVVHGQGAGLERVASATAAQLAKRHPVRPGAVLLLGPTGVGKTSTVEALPEALTALGYHGASIYRLDCGELTDSIQVTRLLGAPPGYVGYAATTPLLEALAKPGCILLVDELEKAHEDVLDLLLGLVDAGRLTSSAGKRIDARHVVIAMTTSVGSDELERRLGRTPIDDRWAVQRACAEHLREVGLPVDLVGRIGTFALFGELEVERARHGLAGAAVTALAAEYGLTVVEVDPVVLDVVADIARAGNDAAGARALHHAARELLAEQFATLAADGPRQRVVIEAGPPLDVRRATTVGSAETRRRG